jgi:hypothetical protein
VATGLSAAAALVAVTVGLTAAAVHAQPAARDGVVTFLISGGAQQYGCTATFRFDWGDGSAPAAGVDRQRALHHTYAAGRWHAAYTQTYARPTTHCSFPGPGGKQFATVTTHLDFLCPAGSTPCSSSSGAAPRFSGPVAPAPVEKPVLPKVQGGVIAPLVAGTVPYWEPITELNRFWGIATRDPLQACGIQACPFEVGHDQVAPQGLERPDPKTPQLLQGLFFTSATGGNQPWSDNAIAKSKLRGWHTPEGVHIGMTMARAKQISPTLNRYCIVQYGTQETCSYQTKPYAFQFHGARRRQVFQISFTADTRKPIVYQIGAAILGDEGRCTVISDVPSPGSLVMNATCWGPLVSATVDSTDGGRFGDLQSVDGGPTLAEDDAGNNLGQVPLPQGLVSTRRVSASEVALDVLQCDDCFPGRGATAPAWPAGAFEAWDLSGSWSFSPGSHAVPIVRFTAHFVGLPDFTITYPANSHWVG